MLLIKNENVALSIFFKESHLKYSLIHNISFNEQESIFCLTLDLGYWTQDYFQKGVDPEHILGNLIFKNVKNLDLDPKKIKFNFFEIIGFDYEIIKEYAKVSLVVEIDKDKDVLLLSFNAQSVDWIPLETYFD